jgi:large subunit ribosomal protein L21
MYAIVEIAGQQYKVAKDQEIFVHRLEGEKGTAVDFDNVLLLDHDGKITVGSPTVNGVLIKAKILEQLRGEKVTVFHKKRRKGYQKENGHRQYFSKVLIEDILTGEAKTTKKTRSKKETITDSSEEVKTKSAVKTEQEVAPVIETKAEKPVIDLNVAENSAENKTE